MKNKLTVLITILFLSGLAGQAQHYTHVVSNSAYQDISNPTFLNGPDSISSSYYLDIDFLFPVFGAFSSFKYDQVNGNPGAYFSSTGYLAIIESPGFHHTHVFAPYFTEALKRRDANSSLAVNLSGSPGNRLLQFQWKNMGLSNHPATEYVNFQVWFNEAEKSVSYHYGPSNMVNSSNDFNVINFFRSTNDLIPSFTSATNLKGDASFPASLTAAHPTSYDNMVGVTNFPPAGTTITFKSATSGINDIAQSHFLSAYPNPTNGLLNIHIAEMATDLRVEIYDMHGRLIDKKTVIKGLNTIDLGVLPEGLYMLKLMNEHTLIASKKISKQ